MRRITTVLACVAAALTAACSDGQDGTDITGRAAASPSAAPTAGDPAGEDVTLEPTEEPTTAPAGPKVFAMGYKATIFTAEKVDVLHVTVAQPRTVPGGEFIKPERGRFLAFTVTFEALAADQSINPFDFLVTTASGERIGPTFGPEAGGTQLNSATLNTGEKAKGVVLFDVPAKGLTAIAYAPAGQILGSWDL